MGQQVGHCSTVTLPYGHPASAVSLSPQKPPLAAKLLAELPDEARVVAGRFPFPCWTPSSTIGQGLEQAWAYDMKEVRRAAQSRTEGRAL